MTLFNLATPRAWAYYPILRPLSGMPIGIPAGTLGWLYLPTPPPWSPPPLPGLPWSMTLGGQGVWTPGPHLRPTRHASWPGSASREKIKMTTKTTHNWSLHKHKITRRKRRKKEERTRLHSRGRLTLSDPCHLELSVRAQGTHSMCMCREPWPCPLTSCTLPLLRPCWYMRRRPRRAPAPSRPAMTACARRAMRARRPRRKRV